MNFFDSYPFFYNVDRIGAQPQRLNRRYDAFIKGSIRHIQDKSILDIGSHDGRWSFAALKAGARNVIGIESNKQIVTTAANFFRESDIPEKQFSFVCGDMLDELDSLAPGCADTVFCFGVLYCTTNQQLLLHRIAKLKPACLLIDTFISKQDGALIELRIDNPRSVPNDDGSLAHLRTSFQLLGYPSIKALNIMLAQIGYRPTYFDWHTLIKDDWHSLEDYREGERVTLCAERII